MNIFPGKYISDNSKRREMTRPATAKGIILEILYDIIISGPACDGDDFKVGSPNYYYIIYYYYDKYCSYIAEVFGLPIYYDNNYDRYSNVVLFLIKSHYITFRFYGPWGFSAFVVNKNN